MNDKVYCHEKVYYHEKNSIKISRVNLHNQENYDDHYHKSHLVRQGIILCNWLLRKKRNGR